MTSIKIHVSFDDLNRLFDTLKLRDQYHRSGYTTAIKNVQTTTISMIVGQTLYQTSPGMNTQDALLWCFDENAFL